MIKTPIQGSVQSFVRKSSKSANLPLMTHFGALWPHCETLDCVSCFPLHFFRALPLPACFTTEQSAVEASLFVNLPFSHDIYQPLCNIYILHAGQRFPTNNLYTCIYYNKHRAISTKQTYISKTDGDTDRIQRT